MADDTEQALTLAITHLERQFEKGIVVRLGSETVEPWPVISTGALTLDLALGAGGLPKGRIVEIFSPESVGKTTLALTVIAQAQKEGGTCAFIDTEHSLDPVYMQALGVDLDTLLFSQPDNGEDALEILDTLVKTGELAVVVVDSVAALVSKAELAGEMGDAHMAPQARLMSQAMRKLVGHANKTNTLVIFTNQLREKVGIMFGNPEVVPGGRALKFYASVRIDMRRKEAIKDKEGRQIGIRVKATPIKNKIAPPYRTAEFDILYGTGINWLGCIFDAAVDRGVITKTGGSYFRYNDESFSHGRDQGIQTLASDLDLAREIEKKLK